MREISGFGLFVAVLGSALLIGGNIRKGQTEGALQYPPASVGEDAQPAPPARMAPESMSPRRIELGFRRARLAAGSLTRSINDIAALSGRGLARDPREGASSRCRVRPSVPPCASGGGFPAIICGRVCRADTRRSRPCARLCEAPPR